MSSRRPEKSYADVAASAPKEAPANSDVTPAVPAYVWAERPITSARLKDLY